MTPSVVTIMLGSLEASTAHLLPLVGSVLDSAYYSINLLSSGLTICRGTSTADLFTQLSLLGLGGSCL